MRYFPEEFLTFPPWVLLQLGMRVDEEGVFEEFLICGCKSRGKSFVTLETEVGYLRIFFAKK